MIHGPGHLRLWRDAFIRDDTTIDVERLDLDGNEQAPSVLRIGEGKTLTINSDQLDVNDQRYHGYMANLSGTLMVNTPGGWELGQGGRLLMSNSVGPAIIAGTPLKVHGEIKTRGGNEIYSMTEFHPDASVITYEPDDILRLRSHTTYQGGTYTGPGGIIQDATAFITAPTTIELGFFDIDGVAENNAIQLHDDLTLNVQRIDWTDNQMNGVLEFLDSVRFTANTATPWEMAGTMNVNGPAMNVVTVAGQQVNLLSDVHVAPSNTLRFEADVSGPGGFPGSGEVIFLGEYSPGSSPGEIYFEGDLSFGSTSRLIMEIGGDDMEDYDRLLVDSTLALGGSLHVHLLDLDGDGDPFAPQVGDAFELFAADALLGTFDDVQFPQLFAGMGWETVIDDARFFLEVVTLDANCDFDGDGDCDVDDLDLLQSSGDIAGGVNAPGSMFDLNGDDLIDREDQMLWLSIAAAANGFEYPFLPGDANLDGAVDVSDFNAWNSNKFTNETGWSAGNFNGDLVVDASDFNIWNSKKFEFSDGVAVPEPNGLATIWIVSLSIILRIQTTGWRRRPTHK